MSFTNIEAMMNNNLDRRGRLIPTYEDVRNFMEHFKNDNEGESSGGEKLSDSSSQTLDEYNLYHADSSPPHDKDLVDLIHK